MNQKLSGKPMSLDQQLMAISQMVQSDQIDKALPLLERLIQVPAAQQPSKALMGLAMALQGRADDARPLLESLPAPGQMGPIDLMITTGSAWFRMGELGQGIRYLKAALDKNGDHPLALARLGACLLAAGRVEEAEPYLARSVELMPKSGGAWLNLARAHQVQGQFEQALEALDQAAPLEDKEPEIYAALRADVLERLGRKEEAVALLRQAVNAGQRGAVENLVSKLAAQGDHDQAWHALREAIDREPENVALLEMAAELASVRGRFGEADFFLERALKLRPESHALWRRRAMMAGRRLGAAPAREAADKALALTATLEGMPRALALAAHAQVQVEEDLHAEAEASYRQAIEVAPRCVPALSGLGQLLMQRGRVDEAISCYEKVREIAPVQGWNQLIQAREVPDDPAVLDQMERAAYQPNLQGPVQTHLLFGLASASEKKKDYDKAWKFAEDANQASKSLLSYRPEVHRQRVEREMARFSRDFMTSRAGWGDPSQVPVFVLGMPRSGTTLVEQILGSHSQVHGAGELSLVPDLIQKLSAWERRLGTRREYPECVDDMSQEESRRFAEKHLEELRSHNPQAQRIVDKLPHNFEHIGLIKLVFPSAKILHMKRDSRDVAMSNFFIDYAAKFGGMGFAYDLSWIGEQLVDHERLMRHWHAVFPDQILEVDYDSLVEDVEGWARKIIGYLDLPWEEGVLNFQELDRSVRTASVWQVRQPVYTTSKAKWKRYESHLEPLNLALAETPPQPVSLPLPKLEAGLFPRGIALLQEGKPAEAQACFEQLIAARPGHAAAHHFRGAALYSQKRYKDAVEAMERSLQMGGQQPTWRENLEKAKAMLAPPAAAAAGTEGSAA
ncbi:MAG: sulfotransferase [Ramlibacter sp.]|uniref:tetratricopeptide repeat-containing sulfotransferase family protein n=1 Tax=Ramlibacter sp. TaxID=1917967 RepID=UPI0026380FF5|nr:sulfotransferase [Ramlibacter sp.]MDH4377986.1 sulfotransferase [Ramlibacter sp.]